MNQSKISVRYAKALFELAVEQKMLPSIKADMQMLASLKNDTDFQYLLHSPVLAPSEKKKVINNTFLGKVESTSLTFLQLLIENKREFFLQDIIRSFLDLTQNYEGIQPVSVISAIELTTESLASMQKKAEALSGKKVTISYTVDTELIGGFIMRIGDKQIDTSIASKLKQIRRQLTDKH